MRTNLLLNILIVLAIVAVAIFVVAHVDVAVH